MKNWIAILCIGFFAFNGCISDDDTPTITYDPPVWQENVVFVSADTTPSAQIDLFVAANNMDTVVTESGLVYVIQEPGESEKPTSGSTVVAWYKGYLVDGQVFDASQGAPFTSPLPNLIEGWREGMPLLGKGGKMWMLLNPALAYGDNPRGGIITPNSVIVFEIELADFR